MKKNLQGVLPACAGCFQNKYGPQRDYASWLTAGTVALIVALSLGLTNCGSANSGSAKEAETERVTVPITVYVRFDREYSSQLATAFGEGLKAKGITVSDGEEGADLVAHFAISLHQKSGFIKVYVNGQLQTTTVASVRLSVVGGGRALSTESAEYDYDEPIPDDDLKRFVAAVANSRNVGQYLWSVAKARERARREAVAAENELWLDANAEHCATSIESPACSGVRAYLLKYPSGRFESKARLALRQAQETAAAEARRADEKMWAESSSVECHQPTRSDACNGVSRYIEQNPGGMHATEAQQLIDDAREQLDRLKDDEAWTRAEASKCAKATGSEDCDGVRFYTANFPAGDHAGEAQKLIERAERAMRCRASCQQTCQQGAGGPACISGCLKFQCGGL